MALATSMDRARASFDNSVDRAQAYDEGVRKTCMQYARDQGWREGYEAAERGWREGFKSGFQLGKKQGMDLGWSIAWLAGYDAGKEERLSDSDYDDKQDEQARTNEPGRASQDEPATEETHDDKGQFWV